MDDSQIILAATATTQTGPYWDVVTAPSPDDRDLTVQLGVLTETFDRLVARNGTAVAQYFRIVRYGILRTVHLFNGVERRMKYKGDMSADEKILAYVWRPEFDYEWVGDRHSTALPVRRTPPSGRVFVVLTRPYDAPDEHGISGTILRWNWVDGDVTLAPIDHVARYKNRKWSKNP